MEGQKERKGGIGVQDIVKGRNLSEVGGDVATRDAGRGGGGRGHARSARRRTCGWRKAGACSDHVVQDGVWKPVLVEMPEEGRKSSFGTALYWASGHT
jgi:hypothetical protein